MDDRDYKAFIVEGEFREPQVIDNISKRFFNHGNCKLIPLPAGENIYMLWKKLVHRFVNNWTNNAEYFFECAWQKT